VSPVRFLYPRRPYSSVIAVKVSNLIKVQRFDDYPPTQDNKVRFDVISALSVKNAEIWCLLGCYADFFAACVGC
jgi:hypothetical protein